jgi:hypothetical protein
MSGIVFGLANYKNAVAGLRIQDMTYGETASTAEAVDEDGNIEQTDVYGRKRTIQGNGNVVAGADLSALTVGGTITVDSIAYKIDKVDIKEGVNAHKTCSFAGSAPMPVTSGGQVGN